jgi:thiol-disulfide isomerase/thioredoxin
MNFIKTNWLFVLLLISVIIFGIYNYKKYRIAPILTTPEIQFTNSNNETFTLENFSNKNAVVIFAASWCRDCREEIPALEIMKKELGNNNFHFITLTDDSFEKIERFKAATGSTFDFYKLKKSLKESDVHSIPTAYIINKKGEVVFSHVGNYSWNTPETIKKIRTLVSE